VISGVPLDKNGEIRLDSLLDVLHPFALFLGATTIAMLLMHGALYLTVKTEGDLQARVRRWVPWLIGLFTVMAAGSAVWIGFSDYGVTDTFTDDVWTLIFPVAALAAYLVMVAMVRRRRDAVAFFASSAVLFMALATISAGLYPNLLKSSTNPANNMTVTNASAEHYTLMVMLVVAIVGIPFVLLYTAGVQYLFSGKVKLTQSSY
jgi:cytochrome d ubiquinol oxidase subunit II